MARNPIANDNDEDAEDKEYADADYVRDRVLELLCELEDEGIAHRAVTRGAAEAIADFVPGDLDCDASGEGDLWAGWMDLDLADIIITEVRDRLEAKVDEIHDAKPGIYLYRDVGIFSAGRLPVKTKG